MRFAPRGLRARSAWAFALLALVLSVSLCMATYQLARWYLLEQRESLATRQAMVNALVVRGVLGASDLEPEEVQAALGSVPAARAVAKVGDDWYSAVVEFTEGAIPAEFEQAVLENGRARQRVSVGGAPYVLVGVQLPNRSASYFEFVPLAEYESTIGTLGGVLTAAAAVATLGGALAGWLLSRRVVRPLGEVASAAQAMTAGDLTGRLVVGDDPDLLPMLQSFNEMAEALERRIQRELRFTADVSHELRTPLTAMASAVSLARRAELGERGRFAVGVLDDQVDHLRRLTLELLEISRIDAGVSTLTLDRVDVPELARRAILAAGLDPRILCDELGTDREHLLDRTRFERVLANLLENADRYAGGATAVLLERDGADLVVSVDDAGPGVAEEDRLAIFGRFHRGQAEQPTDRPKGTGLGLSLVEEHVRLHGGRVTVGDSSSGGARFQVRLPRLPACADDRVSP